MSTLHKEAQGKQLRLRIRIENITIALLAVFSLFLFILTFFPFSKISQTVKILFQKENSEGVDGGQKTALRTEDKKN